LKNQMHLLLAGAPAGLQEHLPGSESTCRAAGASDFSKCTCKLNMRM
jgi:hypothetical protein